MMLPEAYRMLSAEALSLTSAMRPTVRLTFRRKRYLEAGNTTSISCHWIFPGYSVRRDREEWEASPARAQAGPGIVSALYATVIASIGSPVEQPIPVSRTHSLLPTQTG